MANKKATYKDRAPYNTNIAIEKKFKNDYKGVLKNIFVNLSKQITKANG